MTYIAKEEFTLEANLTSRWGMAAQRVYATNVPPPAQLCPDIEDILSGEAVDNLTPNILSEKRQLHILEEQIISPLSSPHTHRHYWLGQLNSASSNEKDMKAGEDLLWNEICSPSPRTPKSKSHHRLCKQSGANSWKLVWLLVPGPAASLQIDLTPDKSGGATRWTAPFVPVLMGKVLRPTFPCWCWNEKAVRTTPTLCFSSLSVSAQARNALAWIRVMRCKKPVPPPPPPTPGSEPPTLAGNKWMWQEFVWSPISPRSHYLS